MKTKSSLLTLLLIFPLLACNAAAQNVVLSVGNFDWWVVLYSGQAFAESWTQAIPYENVSIFADLTAFGHTTETGRAFLTTRLGPGTSLADEVAYTAFTFPSSPSDQLLFSNLTLPAGQYYLSLVGDSPSWGSGWVGSDAPTIEMGPGAALGGSYGFSSPGLSYLPSSAINNGGSKPDFIVAGTAIPEPSTYGILAGTAVFFFAIYSNRKNKCSASTGCA
jgi:hypothetical protein